MRARGPSDEVEVKAARRSVRGERDNAKAEVRRSEEKNVRKETNRRRHRRCGRLRQTSALS